MSRDQNVGRNHNIKTDNYSFERVEHLKYLGKNLTNQNSIQEAINPYPTAFPYGNGIVLHFYQQQESSTTKTVQKVINKRLKTYV